MVQITVWVSEANLGTQEAEAVARCYYNHHSYDSEHSSFDHSNELDESDDELIPWNIPNFDRDYNAEDKKFIELYNTQLTWWNHHCKSWHSILQSLISKSKNPLNQKASGRNLCKDVSMTLRPFLESSKALSPDMRQARLLENLRFLSEEAQQVYVKSFQLQTGVWCSMLTLMQSFSSGLSDSRSSPGTSTISLDNYGFYNPKSMPILLPTIALSELSLPKAETSSSTNMSPTAISRTIGLGELDLSQRLMSTRCKSPSKPDPCDPMRSATTITHPSATSPTANIGMHASTAVKEEIFEESVVNLMERGKARIWTKEIDPKYAHNYS